MMLPGAYWQQPGRSIVEKLLTPFPLPIPSSTPPPPRSPRRPDFDPTSFRRAFFLRDGTHTPPVVPCLDPPSTTTTVASLLLRQRWDLRQVEAYLRTWSSVHAFDEEHVGQGKEKGKGQGEEKGSVVRELVDGLRVAGFGDGQREVAWEMGMVMGRLAQS